MLTGQSGIGLRLPDIPIDSISHNFYDSDIILFGLESDSSSINKIADAPSIMTIPKAYDFHALGMFCKFDVYLDKGSKIPLRFRLGTVGGVDALERKGPTRYNY